MSLSRDLKYSLFLTIETVKFWDEEDVFLILSSELVNRRHFGGKTQQLSSFRMSFREICRSDGDKSSNQVKSFITFERERAQPPSWIEITVLTFLVKTE